MLALVGSLGLAWPSAQAVSSDASHAQAARAAASSEGSRLGADGELARADAYNETLSQGQGVIGEPVGPEGEARGDFSFADDATYQAVLDMGGGVMGVLRVPSISLELPIRHGSGEVALRSGAGHLHGTSLPVGGASTHAVLTGHRGLEGATLFARLDEVDEGDLLYVECFGRALTYEVDRIYPALEPSEVAERCRIERGSDRLSLVTCTPVFLNTHRLVVSAVRVPDEGGGASGDAPESPSSDHKPWAVRYWPLWVVPVAWVGGGVICACRRASPRARGRRGGRGTRMVSRGRAGAPRSGGCDTPGYECETPESIQPFERRMT